MKYIILLFCISFFSIWGSENLNNNHKTSILLYGGIFVNSDLLPISLQGDIAYKKSFISAIGINKETGWNYKSVRFEYEGILAKHSGMMKHGEINGALIGRVPNLLGLPMSFGFGEGLSWASQNPLLENLNKGLDLSRNTISDYDIESRRLLNFLIIEMDYGIPSIARNPRVFVRIHHRSGIWGVFCPPDPPCGSNFLTYGVKINI